MNVIPRARDDETVDDKSKITQARISSYNFLGPN